MIIKNLNITASSWLGEYNADYSLEQLNENIAYPLQDMVEGYYNDIQVFFRPYIVDGHVEVDCSVPDIDAFTIYAKIDNRKIKSCKDLEKLVPELFLQFDDKYTKLTSYDEE